MGPGVLGILVHGVAEFSDGGAPFALFHEYVCDPVADPGVAGADPFGLAELRLRKPGLPLVHQNRPEAHADLGMFRPEPHALAERGGGVFEPARVIKPPGKVLQCEIATRADGHRD